jgi:transposase InsO family protein
MVKAGLWCKTKKKFRVTTDSKHNKPIAPNLLERQFNVQEPDLQKNSGLVNDALLMAVWKRKPSKGLIWHTDRGSQYASDILKEHHIIQSMSRKGNCWDNAVSESFFHTLKTEWVHQYPFETRNEAKQAIFEYIEVFYNRERMHSANDYLSPVDYEIQQKTV